MNAKLKGALVLVGVFALGALAGGAGMRIWMQQERAEEITQGPGRRFERHHLRALERTLNLTREQRDQIEAIMQKYRPERNRLLRELSDNCGAPMKEHKQKIDSEIRALLNPDQQQRFDALLETQGKRFPFMRPPRRGRHGGPHRGRHAPGRGPTPSRSGRGHLIRQFDQDGDGKLGQQEVPPAVWAEISGADSNGDGLVTRRELRAQHAARRPQSPASLPSP